VQLQGARVGDIIKFAASPTEGRVVDFQVLVKAVRAQILPDLTDEWVSQSTEGEFETVDALRDDLRSRITAVKKVQTNLQLRERALDAIIELVDTDAPAPLVETVVENRLHDLGHRLEAQGVTFEQYLTAMGQEPQVFLDELRGQAVPSVKADLALRALADAEALEVGEEDVDAEIVRLAESLRRTPAQVRRDLVSNDQLPAVRSDLRKSKALAWLIEHVDIVDSEGQPIDRADLEPPPAAADDAAPEETA